MGCTCPGPGRVYRCLLSSACAAQDLVNAVLTAYFVVLGTLALTATALPAVEAAFPERLRDLTAFALKDVRVPYLMKVQGDVRLHFRLLGVHCCCSGLPLPRGGVRFRGIGLKVGGVPVVSMAHACAS